MNDKEIQDFIREEEGYSKKPYQLSYKVGDKTVQEDFYTVGHGIVIGKEYKEFTEEELEEMFLERYERAKVCVMDILWETTHPQEVYTVLISMSYNLGCTGLKLFKNFLTCIKNHEYVESIEHLKDSKYYRQLPNRVNRMCKILEEA